MGDLTQTQFRGELTFQLRNRSDAGFTDARLNRWIGFGVDFVSHPSVFAHRELQTEGTITLVTNDNDYTVSAIGGINVTAIRNVYHILATVSTPTAIKRKLKPKNIKWFDQRTLATGGPLYAYAIDGGLIHVANVPSVTENGQLLRVRFWREHPALADGTATLIPRMWDEIVLQVAQWIAELRLGYRELAAETRENIDPMINSLSTRQGLEANDTEWVSEVITESVMGATT